MKKIAFLFFAGLVLASCSEHSDNVDYNVPLDKATINANAEKFFGTIDPNQDWSSIKKGTVSITADAKLDDIVKVQILTESPFGNDNAAILNEATVKKGDVVSLVYDAPTVYDVLFAACVDSKGTYFVKAFNVGQNEVRFTDPAAARMTRSGEGFPSLSSIVLGEPTKSFNALRAEASLASEGGYILVNDDAKGINAGSQRRYTEWNNDSWLNDYLWAPVSATDGVWTIENGTIYKTITEKVDMTTLQWLVRFYLQKTGGEIVSTGNKTNNWKSIVEGTNYFKEYKNHFVGNGEPLTIIPLQMNTTEGKYNNIYYYYFNPANIAGMNEEQIANYIKTLPKFKAIVGYSGNDTFKREKEYLLPYYGDDNIASGATPVSLNIPEGYYIGFFNQKANGDSYNYCMNGCTYGYGPLNKENNHLIGHYFSAMSTELSQVSVKDMTTKTENQTKYGMTPSGMTWDSPRIGIFSANNEAFLCFEDGADCNFSDMIIEISGGIKVTNDPIKPEAVAYTMCFEDEPETADYDMNDVVLRGVRLNDSQIEISLIACGAFDELEIRGLQNTTKLGKKEVHKLFNAKIGEEFVNTVKGEKYFEPITEVFNIDKSVCVEDFLKKITLVNKTTGKTITMPKNGEPPYAIIVPLSFRYPKEKCSIINAYPSFNNWAHDRSASVDWYLKGVENNLYPNMFLDEE